MRPSTKKSHRESGVTASDRRLASTLRSNGRMKPAFVAPAARFASTASIASAVAIGGLLVGLVACTKPALRAADPDSLHSATLIEACALGVPGTSVRAEQRGEGIAVTFATRPSKVEELRVRVRDQAHAHGPNRHQGLGHLGDHQGARDHGLRLWALPAATTSVEETASGAILIVTAVDPNRRAELSDGVKARVAHLADNGCF